MNKLVIKCAGCNLAYADNEENARATMANLQRMLHAYHDSNVVNARAWPAMFRRDAEFTIEEVDG